jgi:hypothetical protein
MPIFGQLSGCSMKINRLRHLISVLEDVKTKNRLLDMSSYVTYDPDGIVSACAAGWAAFDDTFNRQGLTLKSTYGTVTGMAQFDVCAKTRVPHNFIPYYIHSRPSHFIHQMMEFFGLNEMQAVRIFYMQDSATKHDVDVVIENIRSVLDSSLRYRLWKLLTRKNSAQKVTT